jgi:hypothetical protein
MNAGSDRLGDLWANLVKANYEVTKQQIDFLQLADRQQAERINELELALAEIKKDLLAHFKRSLSISRTILLLLSGVFFAFFLLLLLGTSIEGQIGNSKITYSSNSTLQLILSALTLGGGSAAVAQLPTIKKLFKNE